MTYNLNWKMDFQGKKSTNLPRKWAIYLKKLTKRSPKLVCSGIFECGSPLKKQSAWCILPREKSAFPWLFGSSCRRKQYRWCPHRCTRTWWSRPSTSCRCCSVGCRSWSIWHYKSRRYWRIPACSNTYILFRRGTLQRQLRGTNRWLKQIWKSWDSYKK